MGGPRGIKTERQRDTSGGSEKKNYQVITSYPRAHKRERGLCCTLHRIGFKLLVYYFAAILLRILLIYCYLLFALTLD